MSSGDEYALTHAAERLGMDRRRFLAAGGSALAALAALACDSRGPRSAQSLLDLAMEKNATLEAALFRHTSMDSPKAGAKLAGNRFPSYFISPTVPTWNAQVNGPWTLEVGGLVKNPLKLSFDDLVAMRQTTERVDHFCV